MANPLIVVFSLVLAQPSRSLEHSWLDITNASSSEGNIINCTWGVLCRKGFRRRAGVPGEVGFECVPASSWSPLQEVPSVPSGEDSTNTSETQIPAETVSALNQTHANHNLSKTASLRGMRFGGHIGGIGYPGFHPAVHPRPFRPPYRPVHPYYHPWRPYRPYARPWLYPRVWGNAITCPCGFNMFQLCPDQRAAITSSTWRRFAPKGGAGRAEEMPKQMLRFLHREMKSAATFDLAERLNWVNSEALTRIRRLKALEKDYEKKMQDEWMQKEMEEFERYKRMGKFDNLNL